MNNIALDVKNLSVWLANGEARKRVVDNVSFSIEAGETVGLVGESGCGKTMTAMAIMGLLQTPAASIQCDGIEINGKDISVLSGEQRRSVLGRDIAMVFQQPGTALDPVFTIGQQVAAVYRRHVGGGKEQTRKATFNALEMVGFSGVGEIAASYPHQLSGGMRQLAMIAMAMVCKPAVIIADEPTTALDASTNSLILQRLETLQAVHNTAILLISHDLSVVRQICRKIMVMYCGRVVESTDIQSLFNQARHPYSAGLLSCIPHINKGPPVEIHSIPGQVPTVLPSGCYFAPRCDRAEAECRQSVPALELKGGQGVACFRPLS